MEKLNELIKILRTNGVAVIPTDTIYGLVGSALAPEAAARLRRLKKRSPEKSFIVLIADWSDLVKLGVTADEATQRLAEKLWREEPTSIIFPRENDETVALRLPHRAPELRELLRQTGPLAAPRANPAGAPPAATGNPAAGGVPPANPAPTAADEHRRGPAEASLKIVEFSDLECPFCKAFQRAMQKLVAKYPDDVAWVYRPFPLDELHSKARAEAVAAECVAQLADEDLFWQFVDKIFEVTPSNNGL